MIDQQGVISRLAKLFADTRDNEVVPGTRGSIVPAAQYTDGEYHLAWPGAIKAGVEGFDRAWERGDEANIMNPEALAASSSDSFDAASLAPIGGIAAGAVGAVPEGAIGANTGRRIASGAPSGPTPETARWLVERHGSPEAAIKYLSAEAPPDWFPGAAEMKASNQKLRDIIESGLYSNSSDAAAVPLGVNAFESRLQAFKERLPQASEANDFTVDSLFPYVGLDELPPGSAQFMDGARPRGQETVNLSDLITHQRGVFAPNVEGIAKTGADGWTFDGKPLNAPTVYKLPTGELLLQDGNHRLSAAALNGERQALVDMMFANSADGAAVPLGMQVGEQQAQRRIASFQSPMSGPTPETARWMVERYGSPDAALKQLAKETADYPSWMPGAQQIQEGGEKLAEIIKSGKYANHPMSSGALAFQDYDETPRRKLIEALR